MKFPHCIRWCPLLGGGVINITATVKLVRGSEVYWGFLKSFKDGTYEQGSKVTHTVFEPSGFHLIKQYYNTYA